MSEPTTKTPNRKLLAKLLRSILPASLALVALLFVPAGTLKFWQGWAFVIWHLVSTLFFVAFFFRRDPQLLERRLLRHEKIGQQKIILLLLKLHFASLLVLCALDQRHGWTRTWLEPIPAWLTLLALALMAGCQILFIWVMNANRFAASVIQIESGQCIADTGPYHFVRHPMYSVGIAQSFFTPIALGSLAVWPVFIFIFPILIWRLLNEEKMLLRDLPGYAEYYQRTRFRLIPFVW